MAVIIFGAGEARNSAINTVPDELMREVVDKIDDFSKRGKFACRITKSRNMEDMLTAVGEALRDYGYTYSTYSYDSEVALDIQWFKAPYDN